MPHPKVDGVDVLGHVGYGTAADKYTVEGLEGDAFGFMLGIDAGYTFRGGLRLGLNYTQGCLAHGGVSVFARTSDAVEAGGIPTSFTFWAAPGFAALWQLGPLELGAALKYYGFAGSGAGPGFSGTFLAGGRFF